ncbi:serine hydrolase domain-containing protein [Paenibacillus sp. CAU 1782]
MTVRKALLHPIKSKQPHFTVKKAAAKLGIGILTVLAALATPSAYAAEAKAVTPSGISVGQIEAYTDEVMEKYVGKDVPGAAVSIVMNGEIVLLKGYGFADIEKKTAINPQTTYMEAGSVSKLFTWTAVMQLVEQGKLDLDQDISVYLADGYLDPSLSKEPLTLAHLMSHTGGFEESVEGMLVEDANGILPLEDYLGPGKQPKQIYSPGTVIAYSNFGTDLAGLIVERVSGMAFEDYINTYIFKPLGMAHSFFDQRYDSIPGVMENKSLGYGKEEDDWVAKPAIFINDMPAGSLQTTAEDLAYFMLAHMEQNVPNSAYSLFKDQETLTTMHSPLYRHHPDMPGNAHGFWERFAGEVRVLEHGGNTDGFTSQLSLAPKEGIGISILTNAESEMAGARSGLIKLFIGSTFAEPQQAASLDHSKDVAGRYRSARAISSRPLKVFSVLADGDTLVKANRDGTIKLLMPEYDIALDYVETAPYLYQRIDAEDTPLDQAGLSTSRLYFQTDDQGNVTLMSFGVLFDLLPVSFAQTTLFSYIWVGSCLLVFATGAVFGAASLVKYRKNRNRLMNARLLPWHKAVLPGSVIGLLTIANMVIVIVRLIAAPFQPIEALQPHGWVFGALAIGFVVAAVLSFRNGLVKKASWKQWTGIILLILSFSGLTAFLVFYQFYSFM